MSAIDFIQKDVISYNQNVGGVNYGRCENILQFLELADGHNYELIPTGGYRKRNGTQMFIDQNTAAEGFVNPMPQAAMLAVWMFDNPAGPRNLLFFHKNNWLLRVFVMEEETLCFAEVTKGFIDPVNDNNLPWKPA